MECHECGATISDKAADCPHCGTSIRSLSDEPGTAPHRDDPPDSGPRDARNSERSEPSTERPPDSRDAPDGHDPADEATADRRDERVTDQDGSAGRNDGASGDPLATGPGPSEPPIESTESDESVDGPERDGSRTRADRDESIPGPEPEQPPGASEHAEPVEETSADEPAGMPTDEEPLDQSSAGASSPSPTSGGETDSPLSGGETEGDSSERETGGDSAEEEPSSLLAGSDDSPGTRDEALSPDTPGSGGAAADWREGAGDGSEPDGADEDGPESGDADRESERAARGSGLGAAVGRSPLLPSAVAGLATGVFAFALAVAVAVAFPGGGSTLDLATVVLFDLHAATTGRVAPGVFGVFEVARPPDASLGLLYLAVPLALYTAGKLVVALNVDESAPLSDAAVAGLTVTVGYLPVVLAASLVVPDGAGEFSLPRGLLVAGLAYPLAFGTLGGLAGGAFTAGERRIGALYGVVSFFVLSVGAFVATFVAVDVPAGLDVLGRALLSLFAVVGAHTFALDGGPATGLATLGVVAVVVALAGFLRVWRAPPVRTPSAGFRKGITLAATYAVLLGVLATVLPVFADGYVQSELGIGLLGSFVVDGFVGAQLSTLGDYAVVVAAGTLAFPVVLGGGAGAVAAWAEARGDSSAADESPAGND